VTAPLKTILLTGKTGQVGHELVTALQPLGRVIAVGREQMNLAMPDSVINGIRTIKPDIIVNAAAYTAVDDAEAEPELALQINATAPGVMAEEAKNCRALLIHYSTDYVFDGRKDGVYTEADPPNPLNAYGRTKLAGEKNIVATGCRHLILRTSWIYSGRGTNFLLTMLDLARKHSELRVVEDQIGSPTWARTLAEKTAAALDIADSSGETGIYHLSADGHTSRHAFAKAIIDLARESSGITDGWAGIMPCTTAQFPRPAVRPLNAATAKNKIRSDLGISMPRWESDLKECMLSLGRFSRTSD